MLIANIFRQKSKFVSCPVVHSSVNKFLGSSIPSNVVMALLLCKVFTACLLLGEEIQIVHQCNSKLSGLGINYGFFLAAADTM